MIAFKDMAHLMRFQDLVTQMALSETVFQNPTPLLKRQLAFIYLIAYYQEDYKVYEGENFYIVPNYDDVNFSVGGPTYLLEEQIGVKTYSHEIILEVARALLEGQDIKEKSTDETITFLIHQAKSFVKE